MLRRNRPVEEIAEDTGLTAEEVEALKTNRPISARDQIRSRAFFLLCRSTPPFEKAGWSPPPIFPAPQSSKITQKVAKSPCANQQLKHPFFCGNSEKSGICRRSRSLLKLFITRDRGE